MTQGIIGMLFASSEVWFVPNGGSGLPAALIKDPAMEVNARVCRSVICFNPVNTPKALIALCKGTKDH